MPDWLKKLYELFDDPQRHLEEVYNNLLRDTVILRKNYFVALALVEKLEKELADPKISPEKVAELETELIRRKTENGRLKTQLDAKHAEVEKAYIRKQVMIASRKASDSYADSDSTRATLVIIAIMTVWALFGVYLNLKGNL